MTRAKTPASVPIAVALASRLRTAMANDPDFRPDDLPRETAGVREPGAVFHLNGRSGERWRVRVNRVD